MLQNLVGAEPAATAAKTMSPKGTLYNLIVYFKYHFIDAGQSPDESPSCLD